MEFYSEVFSWFASRPELAGKIVLGSILLALLSVAMTLVVITRINPDYFILNKPPVENWRRSHPLLRILFKALKNAAGLVLLITGIAMLVFPGQGLLTLLVGIGLLDFPGKRKIELYLVRNHHVLKTINWIRARNKQAPVTIDR